MNDAPRYASLRDYLRVIHQHRWVVLVCTVLVGLAALWHAARQDKRYRAESAVELRDISADIALQNGSALPILPNTAQANALAGQIDSYPLAVRVRDRLNLKVNPNALRGLVNGQVDIRTAQVAIQATAGNAEFAARLANAYAKEAVASVTDDQKHRVKDILDSLLVQRRKLASNRKVTEGARTLNEIQLNADINRLQAMYRSLVPADVSAYADVPGAPFSPKPIRDTFLGLLLGLTIGIILSFIRDSLDRRLRSAADVREHLGFPVIAMFSEDGLGTAAISANGTKPIPAQDLEAVRILRKNLAFLDLDKPPKTVAVTSGLPEEGKSTIASNLALTQALAGRRTLLLECDLRRPSLAHRLGVNERPGLTEYLTGEAQPSDVLQVLPLAAGGGEVETAESLVVITAGGPAPRPAETLDTERFRALLDQLSKVYDSIVIDTAPILPVVDTLALLPHVDSIVVCARTSQTTRDQALAVRSALNHLPPKPTGIVVTGSQGPDEAYSYYSYAYSERAAT